MAGAGSIPQVYELPDIPNLISQLDRPVNGPAVTPGIAFGDRQDSPWHQALARRAAATLSPPAPQNEREIDLTLRLGPPRVGGQAMAPVIAAQPGQTQGRAQAWVDQAPVYIDVASDSEHTRSHGSPPQDSGHRSQMPNESESPQTNYVFANQPRAISKEKIGEVFSTLWTAERFRQESIIDPSISLHITNFFTRFAKLPVNLMEALIHNYKEKAATQANKKDALFQAISLTRQFGLIRQQPADVQLKFNLFVSSVSTITEAHITEAMNLFIA